MPDNDNSRHVRTLPLLESLIEMLVNEWSIALRSKLLLRSVQRKCEKAGEVRTYVRTYERTNVQYVGYVRLP